MHDLHVIVIIVFIVLTQINGVFGAPAFGGTTPRRTAKIGRWCMMHVCGGGSGNGGSQKDIHKCRKGGIVVLIVTIFLFIRATIMTMIVGVVKCAHQELADTRICSNGM